MPARFQVAVVAQLSLAMRSSCFACVAAVALPLVLACQSEHKHVFHAERALSKRQETTFPPVLTEEESVLVNNIDNTTIDEW